MPTNKQSMKLITESCETLKPLIEEVNGQRTYFIEGVFLQGEIKNQNGRIYPIELLAREVARYNKQYVDEARAYGELGHPDGPNINLDRVSHMVKSMVQDGNNFIGKAKILDTPMGKIVKSLMDEGAKLGVSSRGVGSLRQTTRGLVVQNDYYLSTAADIVAEPSAPDAFVRGIMEGKEWVWENGILREAQIARHKAKVTQALSRKQSEARQTQLVEAFESFISDLSKTTKP